MAANNPNVTSMLPAVRRKLAEAEFFFIHLSRQGGALAYGYHFDFYLSAFLSAGYSVVDGLRNNSEYPFKDWYASWRGKELQADEQKLLSFMWRQRSKSVHSTGAKVKVGNVVIPIEEYFQGLSHRDYQVFMHQGVPGTRPPNQFGKAYTFPALDDRDVVDVCRVYLTLLSRLVSDFERHIKS